MIIPSDSYFKSNMAATKTCFLFDQQTVELLKSFTLIDKSTNGEHSLEDEDITELQGRGMLIYKLVN